VLHSEQFADPFFELLHQRSIVRQPAPIEHVVDAREESVAFTDVWRADIEICLHEANLRFLGPNPFATRPQASLSAEPGRAHDLKPKQPAPPEHSLLLGD
jgi:hypothetical protein